MSLPPGIATQLNMTGEPVTPRPAATVVLVRGTSPWELMLVHRPGGADFAPGAYVFPGGAVHEDDRSWADEIRGAAVRELFEEAGILLARRDHSLARDPDCERVRELVDRNTPFSEAMRSAGLEPAFDRLVMFARWITPAQLRRRFDTRFYLARVPAHQTVRPQEGEVTDWTWITPARALSSNEVTLVYATRAVLESVDVENVGTLFARARRMREVPVVEPRIVQTERGWEIVR